MIHRYTWRRGREDEQKGLIDYISVGKRIKSDVMYACVVRGMVDGSHHHAVLMKLKMNDRWTFKKERMEVKKRLRLDRFREKN